MDRRVFIAAVTGGLLAIPFAAEAQQAGKVYQIGFLALGSSYSPAAGLDAFYQGLRDYGWTSVLAAMWEPQK